MIRPAVLAVLGLLCLVSGGCVRMLKSILAPQSSVIEGASEATQRVSYGGQQELAGVGREVDRLMAGPNANDELARLNTDLKRRRAEAAGQPGSAQVAASRGLPRDARLPAGPGDSLVVDRKRRPVDRFEPRRSAPLPDGTPASVPIQGLDLRQIRVRQPGSGDHGYLE